MMDYQQLAAYLSGHVTDPVPCYLLQKEILGKADAHPDCLDAYRQVMQSKWYRELASEQLADGTWGRFHTQDSKFPVKRRFVTTEIALRRARELGLTKEDPMVARCIGWMEQVVRGEITWSDPVEKHGDGGKSHLRARHFLTAADICVFAPLHPLIQPLREVFVQTLAIACESGTFSEEAWERENKAYRGPCLTGWNAYALMLLPGTPGFNASLEKRYLDYLWYREKGVYYLLGSPISALHSVEDKRFIPWLSTLWHLSEFSLFAEYARDIMPHLLREASRLVEGDVVLPASAPAGGSIRYADNWRDRQARNTDLMLRIARVLAGCLKTAA